LNEEKHAIDPATNGRWSGFGGSVSKPAMLSNK
jgi:hypothetical protein